MMLETVAKSCRDQFRGAHIQRITVRLGLTDAIQLQTLCSEMDVPTTQVVRAGIRAIYGCYEHELAAGSNPDGRDENESV